MKLFLLILFLGLIQSSTVLAKAELKAVGSRGFFTTVGAFAEFDPKHPSVELWLPESAKAQVSTQAKTQSQNKAPIIVYAHGGAGYRDDDEARVALFRRNGFATLSFDAYEMNGFDDWRFVTRKVTNLGKQNMIWGVFKGSVSYAAKGNEWDSRNIFFYGGSNGGRVILYAGSKLKYQGIRGIISEAPAGSGYTLEDYDIPTIIPFGKKDNWAGRSETDFVWRRTYPSSPVSIQEWVESMQANQRPVKLVFYENAGHLLFDGPLKKVTVKRGKAGGFTAYKGAADGVLEQYEADVLGFVEAHTVK